MARISIAVDEVYPVYLVGQKRNDEIPEWQGKYDAIVEVDHATLQRWSQVEDLYDAVQREMSELFKQNRPG